MPSKSHSRPFPTALAGVLAGLATLTLLALAAGPADASSPDASAPWLRVTTQHFALVTDLEEPQARRLGWDLERMRGALAETVPELDLVASRPLAIYVFASPRSFAPYQLRDGDGRPLDLRGYFVRHGTGNLLVAGVDRHHDPREILYHEYFHALADENFADLPLWLAEGLAELYSTFEVEDDRATLGLVIPPHLARLRETPLLGLEDLLQAGARATVYHGGAATAEGSFYARSWALAHYLLVDDAERRTRTSRLVEMLRQGHEPAAAVEASLGKTLGRLEAELRGYVRRPRLGLLTYELTSRPGDGTQVTVTALSDRAAGEHLGDLLAVLADLAER